MEAILENNNPVNKKNEVDNNDNMGESQDTYTTSVSMSPKKFIQNSVDVYKAYL